MIAYMIRDKKSGCWFRSRKSGGYGEPWRAAQNEGTVYLNETGAKVAATKCGEGCEMVVFELKEVKSISQEQRIKNQAIEKKRKAQVSKIRAAKKALATAQEELAKLQQEETENEREAEESKTKSLFSTEAARVDGNPQP